MDVKDAAARWLDVVVPIRSSMRDDDLRLEATWTFPAGDVGAIRKLEYYGLTRSGYMGGSGSMMIGPTGVPSNTVTVALPTVSSIQEIAKRQGIEDPVLHVFVMFSDGEPTMALRGQWNGTDLAYGYGNDAPVTLRAEEFEATRDDAAVVSAQLPLPNPERMVALAFDAEETAGLIWRSPSYERPDGSSQAMKIPLLAEFSKLSGTWRFEMMTGDVLEPDKTVVWGTLFDPARPMHSECGT